MITDAEKEARLEQSPAPRVTKDQMEARISQVTFMRLSTTVTLCNIELDNGFSVRGESACVNPANYDQEIGERIAYDAAFNRLWPLFGFLLAEQQYQAK